MVLVIIGIMAKKINPKKYPNMVRRVIYGGIHTTRLKGRILVFREKHGNRYFPADTPEKTMYACLQILTERHGPDADWGSAQSYIDSLKEYAPDQPEMPLEEAEKLPYTNIRDHVVEQWKKYKKDIEGRSEEIRSYRAIKKAIEDKDPYLALQAVWNRRDMEYEKIDFEWMEDVKENGFFDRMTWTCHVCGDRRPDKKISVSSEKTQSSQSNHTFHWHIRYCNDKTKCGKIAREMAKMENPWKHPERKGPRT